nr:AMP-binding protein [Bacillus subtilis]
MDIPNLSITTSPTEATIGAIAGRVDLSEPDAFAKRPTIGRPIANAGALVLNEALKLVPPGASGQLYITGQGLARGYLNRASADSREICRKSIFAGKPHVQNRRCRTKTF